MAQVCPYWEVHTQILVFLTRRAVTILQCFALPSPMDSIESSDSQMHLVHTSACPQS